MNDKKIRNLSFKIIINVSSVNYKAAVYSVTEFSAKILNENFGVFFFTVVS